ncbi:MAG: energy transducer TonB [Cytophagales bacterium]
MRYIIIIIFFWPNILFSQDKARNYGGQKEKKRMFEQELYYAPGSLNKYYGGKVELDFDLDENAQVSNIQVLKSVSKELNEEAIRLLKLMLWIPAQENGQAVKSHESISFMFNPKKYKQICNRRGYELEKPDLDFTFKVYREKDLSSMPGFRGKEKNFQNYVKENLQYPEAALKYNAQGIVEIQFVVEPSGRLTNIHLAEKLEANCDIVAKELILRSKWRPGNINGLPVRTLMSRKIYFSPKGKQPFISIPEKE